MSILTDIARIMVYKCKWNCSTLFYKKELRRFNQNKLMHCIVWIWFECIRKGIKELLEGATQNISFGMTCPVAECPNLTYFRRYGQLLDHWVDVHKEKRKRSKCKSCKKCFKTKASARKHVSASHRKNNVGGLLVDIMVHNRSYILPGNTPLPRKMSQIEERARKREKRGNNC